MVRPNVYYHLKKGKTFMHKITLKVFTAGLWSAAVVAGTMALASPSLADTKPCCRNNGQFFNSSPSTCRNYGGRVVDQQYCQADSYQYSRRGQTGFSISLGNIVFGYSDGYYDPQRRWHKWRNRNERRWYQENHGESYYEMNRRHDNDRHRRDWRDGRRDDWRGDDNRR